MKPNDIKQILDLATKCREQGRTFNPLFSGDAGIGKSEICQMWVKDQQKKDKDFGFIDLRLAVMEAQDLVGYPRLITNGNETKTSFAAPDFWPKQGSGLLLLEEPNRADASCMNAVMQLLTDRKVHNYKLPDGWIIAGAINPEDGLYDVNTMDPALKDRFEIFEINYDFNTFSDFMVKHDWSNTLISFIQSGVWQFKSPGEVVAGETYISPRTFSKLNNAELVGVKDNSDLFYETCVSKLGKKVGMEYFTFVQHERPILIDDLIKDLDGSIKRMQTMFSKDSFRGDMAEVLINSVKSDLMKHEGFTENHLIKVAELLPSEIAIQFLAATFEAVEVAARAQEEAEGKEGLPRRLNFIEIKKNNKSLFKRLHDAQKAAVVERKEVSGK